MTTGAAGCCRLALAEFTDNRDTRYRMTAGEFAAQFVEASGEVVQL